MKNGRLFRDSPLGNYVSGCILFSTVSIKDLKELLCSSFNLSKNTKISLTTIFCYATISTRDRKENKKMYILKEETKQYLMRFKLSNIAKEIGINYDTLSKMIKQNKSCIKITAYALTKYLDSEKEILDFFERKEK